MGTRLEFYIIAENIDTKLMTWVIVDYDTNTVSFDSKNGLHGSTTKECIHTTDCNGSIITSIISNKDNKKFIVNASITQREEKALDQRLWLEGNLSIAYGKGYDSKAQKAFSVIFNPREVSVGLKIPNESVEVISNTWYRGLYESKPSQIVCFQYAQHFLSDSQGHYSSTMNKSELEYKHENINFNDFPSYSTKPIKKI